MANVNVAFGLRPVGVVGQATNTTGVTEYRISSSNTNAIYQGAPVIPLSTGFIDRVGAAAGGSVGLLGVFWGCEYVSASTGKKVWSNYWPGSGANSTYPVKAYVYDNPLQVFDNIAIGSQAGYNLTTGDNNIVIGHAGVAGESGVIRIGTLGKQTNTYLTGVIHGNGSGLTNLGGINLAAGTVSTPALANNAVTSGKIADGSITSAKLANSSVGSSCPKSLIAICRSVPS